MLFFNKDDNYRFENIKICAPCPHCEMGVNWGERRCKHCGEIFSPNDIQSMKVHLREHRKQGLIRGAYLWTVSLALLTLILFKVFN